ncbi:FecR family protein [Sinomicrobium soli]|uniref:FecR family protein n=1 Tax=Sinomicrobium sp. N-1-3-6 TaxID=2219864 RepID=UPI000DCEAEE9|nr:FecR domain-containing protein [Sinomicrobium sp. N-1-3-6]RAV28740.1 hypothetical protein DN748_12385 [Sinomicrobium sp. N-1-3-6]
MDELHLLWQKHLDGTLSPEEADVLLKAVQRPENELWFSRLLKAEWENAVPDTSSPAYNSRVLEKIRKGAGMGTSRKPVRKAYRFAIAASILVMLTAGLSYFFISHYHTENFVRIEVAEGEPESIFLLPDSSRVALREASVLEYRENFITDREIRLQGEAYFEVKHDTRHPFYVNFDGNRLLVTGTKFLVSSFKKDTVSRVDVEEGSVRVYHHENSTDLVKNTRLLINRNNGMARIEHRKFNDTNGEIPLDFRGVPLEKVIGRIQEHYHARIHTGAIPESVMKTRITLTYPRQTSFGEAIEGITVLLELKADFTDEHTVVLKPQTGDAKH